jgi:hypothetical protein
MFDSEKWDSGILFKVILNGKDNIVFPAHPKIPKQVPYILPKKLLKTYKTVQEYSFLNSVLFLQNQSNNYSHIILNVQKKSYVINKHWIGQKMISVFADCSEHYERVEVAEGGERCLSHWSWMMGESGWDWECEEVTEGFCMFHIRALKNIFLLTEQTNKYKSIKHVLSYIIICPLV